MTMSFTLKFIPYNLHIKAFIVSWDLLEVPINSKMRLNLVDDAVAPSTGIQSMRSLLFKGDAKRRWGQEMDGDASAQSLCFHFVEESQPRFSSFIHNSKIAFINLSISTAYRQSIPAVS